MPISHRSVDEPYWDATSYKSAVGARVQLYIK